MDKLKQGPYVRIIEQPARSAVRFRYECEGRSAGPIPGVSSSPSCATFPTIQVMNYCGGRAMVMVSCVTASPPYRQHPHHLVGRVGCHDGICTMIIDNNDHICTFTHLGIQCAKRNEIASRLKHRKMMAIDPMNAGFDHISKSSRSIDLGVIRLCFQVYIEDPVTGKFTIPLEAVVSDPVHDKKLLPKLIITDISSTSAPITGGKVMIYCNYNEEDDIEVRFYETDQKGALLWESMADLKPPVGEVHKRVGISLMAPSYHNPSIRQPASVYLQLRRPSDQRTSDPMLFTYLPDCHNCPLLKYQQFNGIQLTSLSASAPIKRPKPKAINNNNYNNNNNNNSNNNNNNNCKKPRILNIINGSDTESEDDLHTTPSTINENSLIIKEEEQFLNKYNIIECKNNEVTSDNNCNDLLVECLKTIDLQYLASLELFEYNDDDWSAFANTFNHNNIKDNYIDIN